MPDLPPEQAPSPSRGNQPPRETAGVIAPPPIIYAVPLVAGLLLQRWRPITIAARPVATMAGIVFLVLGLVGLPAVLAFRRARTSPKPWVPTTALVTSGPYRFSRNPMYLGFTLLYTGASLLANAAWPLFFLPMVLVVMHYGVIVREEAYMARRFGEEYERYRGRVRRWL